MYVISNPIFVLAVALTIAFVTGSIELEPVEEKMVPTFSSTHHGIVFGAKSCGGEGKFVQYNIPNICNTTYSPCHYPADGKLRDETITFYPSKDTHQLGFRLLSSVNGSAFKVDVDMPLPYSAVKGYVRQTVTLPCSAPSDLVGTKYIGRDILYRMCDGVIEACVEAEFKLVRCY